MLTRIEKERRVPVPSKVSVRIGDASFPLPFGQRLEFNPPVHGTWNIVHIGMSVPQSHSIYVCSDNCMRGVVMTAAEMGAGDRFSCVTVREQDTITDNLESVTVEGVTNVLEHLDRQPPVVFLFLVCLHIFVASDEAYILKTLGARFPKVRFIRCYMDCIRQKTGPTPECKLRSSMFEAIDPLPDNVMSADLRAHEHRPLNPRRVNILGCDVAFRHDSELIRMLSDGGFEVRQLQDCRTFADYQALGEASVNLCTYMNAQDGVKALSVRTGAEYLYLPPAVDTSEIKALYGRLSSLTGALIPEKWMEDEENACRKRLSALKDQIKDTPVTVDYTFHPRPLGIAYLLLSAGIRVERVYLDAVLDEEWEVFEKLREEYPDLELTATIQPQERRSDSNDIPKEQAGAGGIVIALGQKAAWFEQSVHFANEIEGAGLWGFEGIRLLCDLILEAFLREKDLWDIVPRKGLGLESSCCVPGREPGNGGSGSVFSEVKV